MLETIDPEFRDLIGYPAHGPDIEPGSLKLAPRHEKLAQLLASGVSQKDAAAQCGWKSITPCRSADVVERAGFLSRELWQAEHMGPDELLAHVAAVVRFDPAALFDERGNALNPDKVDVKTRRAIQGVKIEETEDEDKDGRVRRTRRVEYKASDKAAAQDKLMKRHGLYERDNAQTSTGRTLVALLGMVQEESRGVGELFDALPGES